MKKYILMFAAIFAAVCLQAEPVKIKFNDLAELGAALRALDGNDKSIQTSEGTRVIRVPLDLKASARIAIARNLSAVRTALEAFEQQRQQLLQQVSPGAIQKVQNDPELLTKFLVLWTEATKDPVTLDLQLLTEEQLSLEANKEITGSVLAGLAPILATPKK